MVSLQKVGTALFVLSAAVSAYAQPAGGEPGQQDKAAAAAPKPAAVPPSDPAGKEPPAKPEAGAAGPGAEAPAEGPPEAAAEGGAEQPVGATAPPPDAAVAGATAEPGARRADGRDEQQGDDQADQKKGNKKKKRGTWKNPELRVGGRVYVQLVATDEDDRRPTEFRVSTARLKLDFRQTRMIQAAIDAELASELEQLDAWSQLRDAFVRFAPLRALRLTAGQFKKPFSRLEMDGLRRLPVIERGVGSELLVRWLGYGSRDIGVKVDGRTARRTGFRYAVGVFNGTGRNTRDIDRDGSKDLVGRVEYRPIRELAFGASGSYKSFDQREFRRYTTHYYGPNSTNHPVGFQVPVSALAGGADIRFRGGGLTAYAQGLYGHNFLAANMTAEEYSAASRPKAFDALLLIAYEIRLREKRKLAIQPVVKGELLAPDDRQENGYVWLGTLGANLLLGRHLRLMVNGEVTHTTSTAPADWTNHKRLLVQTALDM